MTDEDARQLLLDAGVPEERIDHQAVIIASAIGDAISRFVAKRLAESFAAKVVKLLPRK